MAEKSTSSAWDVERENLLRDMWKRGFTATEIANHFADVSRNAVIAKAHRLGLGKSNRTVVGDAESDRWLFLEDTTDPIRNVIGYSTSARMLWHLKWDDGTVYLSADSQKSLRLAGTFAANKQPLELTAEHLLLAIVKWGGSKRNPEIRNRSSLVRPRLAAWNHLKPADRKLDLEVARWDIVDLVATASNLRARLHADIVPIDLPLLLLAYFYAPGGRQALVHTGLGDAQMEPFRQYASAVFIDYAQRVLAPERRSLAKHILDEVAHLEQSRGPGSQTAGFENDAVDLAKLDPFVRRDAKALADLILLEAAAPPLAIGVFGAWGSGKSTLLGALRHEIETQAQQEQALVAAGAAPSDPATRRVSGVLQLELNAWTFADSGNLWASLTSDIFDQIAAGGSGAASAAIGKGIFSDIINRTNKEAEKLQAAKVKLEASELQIATTDKALAAARLDARMSGVDAAFGVALDMLGPEEKAKSETGSENRKDRVPEAGKDYLGIFRSKVLLRGEATDEVRIRRYAEAGTHSARLGVMIWDFVKSLRIGHWALVFLGTAIVGVVAYLLADTYWMAARGWITSVVSTLSWLGIAAYQTLPAWRAAGLLTSKIKEKQEAAQEKVRKLSAVRDEAEKAQTEAAVEIAHSREFAEKYAPQEDGAISHAVVLSYLLKDSSEITLLKSSLGTLGTVRKAFEKLNAALQAQPKGEKDSVERIVIYLDDLDRCSKKQVVQIIEAIHLLLAFPCFVVVAAVDARWLQTALTEAHAQLAREESGVTAADYLEKIFQIAYWVQPLRSEPGQLDGGNYGRLIDNLAGSRETDAPGNGIAQHFEGADTLEAVATVHGPLERLDPKAPDLEPEAARERVKLTEKEVRLFRDLGLLAARSPRAVKRMVNVYRLIRATSEVEDNKIFIVGPDIERVPAHLVQLALACEAGLSAGSMSRLVQAIETANPSEWSTWESLIEGRSVHYDGQLARAFDRTGQFREFLDALGIVRGYLDGSLFKDELVRAFTLAGRYSFRMPGADIQQRGSTQHS
jgi:hypothetical protein